MSKYRDSVVPSGIDPEHWCDGWTKLAHYTEKPLDYVVTPSTAPGDSGYHLYLCPDCLAEFYADVNME